MNRFLLILMTAIVVQLIPQNGKAAEWKKGEEKTCTYDVVIQRYLDAGFKIESTTTESNTFDTPQKALKKLEKWGKQYKKASTPKRTGPVILKMQVFDMPSMDFWSCKYKKFKVSFATTGDPAVFETGSEEIYLEGFFFLKKGRERGNGEVKAMQTGDKIRLEAMPVWNYRVVMDGKVLTKTETPHVYSLSVNLKNRTALVREIWREAQ